MSKLLIGTIKPYELDFLISRGILKKTARLLSLHDTLVNHIQDDLRLYVPFCPTHNWSQGGPLISSYNIKNSGNLMLAMRDLWFLKRNEETELLLEEEIKRVRERR